jgi:hypothetical protein
MTTPTAIKLAQWRAWLAAPRLTGWFLALLAAVLYLRKPSGLLTPQLWAEDGSIFLTQNDQVGLRALLEPYMGYLHTIPRLIAWVVAKLLDPAWWPLAYNGAAFLISLGVAARMLSPRLALPGAPWLALAFFLGPQTGEVLTNITNLQWITALLLVQQTLVARPVGPWQRAGDLLIVLFVGLTGPFVIAFWPLLAWRWWRARHLDNLAVLLVATACAAVQGWFVVRTGPHFPYQDEAFHAAKFFPVIGRRLLVWTVLGDKAAFGFPPLAVALAGGLPLALLLGGAARPGPQRAARLVVAAAFLLIFAASVYRTRPDTWDGDNLYFADRYFYIPRVLLLWLLIWEALAAERVVAWTARALLLCGLIVHLKGFSLPAPPDYHWADHCDPIRRGVPAKIPTLPEEWWIDYQGRHTGK